MNPLLLSSAETAYDALAGAYDDLTAAYCHDVWLERIEALVRDHGVTGSRALDVACGTGKSFLPLLERGWDVVACDVSAEMARLAQEKAGARAEVHHADMRVLPELGEFDLVLCLDDAMNYLLDDFELSAALRSIAANLAPDGLLVFDVNALPTYRSTFAGDWVHESEDHLIVWRGKGHADAAPGSRSSAAVEVFTRTVDGLWERRTSVHHQRHWPHTVLCSMLAEAGLRLVDCRGQQRGAVLVDDHTCADNHKLLYVAALAEGGVA